MDEKLFKVNLIKTLFYMNNTYINNKKFSLIDSYYLSSTDVSDNCIKFNLFISKSENTLKECCVFKFSNDFVTLFKMLYNNNIFNTEKDYNINSVKKEYPFIVIKDDLIEINYTDFVDYLDANCQFHLLDNTDNMNCFINNIHNILSKNEYLFNKEKILFISETINSISIKKDYEILKNYVNNDNSNKKIIKKM